jgi:hypothetical protein
MKLTTLPATSAEVKYGGTVSPNLHTFSRTPEWTVNTVMAVTDKDSRYTARNFLSALLNSKIFLKDSKL